MSIRAKKATSTTLAPPLPTDAKKSVDANAGVAQDDTDKETTQNVGAGEILSSASGGGGGSGKTIETGTLTRHTAQKEAETIRRLRPVRSRVRTFNKLLRADVAGNGCGQCVVLRKQNVSLRELAVTLLADAPELRARFVDAHLERLLTGAASSSSSSAPKRKARRDSDGDDGEGEGEGDEKEEAKNGAGGATDRRTVSKRARTAKEIADMTPTQICLFPDLLPTCCRLGFRTTNTRTQPS
jgi:hypothetical protein